MQTYDVLMLVVLLATTLFGFWKGMAWQIASLASLVLSYFAALRFSDQLAPSFGEHAPLNKFVAMLVIYVVTSFVIWTLFRLVSGAIDKVRLESFDRQLGAMFGFAKGVLLCVAITFFAVSLLPQPQGEMIVSSQSGRYIVALLDKSHTVFPPEIHDVIDPYVNQIEQRLNPNFQQQPQTAGDLQKLWQKQVQAHAPAGWPQINWPQPQEGQPPQQQQPAWPSLPQSLPQWPSPNDSSQQVPTPQYDPYRASPREPKPFPGPYSAEVPASRDY